MKTFAKEMWHLLVFTGALVCFNIGLKAAIMSFVDALDGDIKWVTFLYMVLVAIALGMLTLKTFEWLHKQIAETRGMKYFKAAIEKHTAELNKHQKEIEDKILEYSKNNKELHNANLMLADELRKVKAELYAERKPVMVEQHFDDWALNQFVTQLRAKLKRKRGMGRAGWNDCQITILHDLLVEEVESLNVEKMDMVDIGNYAMMCWMRDAFPVECESAALKSVRQIEA
ncbi:hypothetical protein CNR34_00109 [Pseudomonas phage nickie]|uniref:Uncharacterized protein n=1 Tax=Pseudomonas phage nickie TaxID=2048977 RepID=A0A2H4P787_9CAUD|nr:hypothetical protein FDJ16_gp056 [Pseudomonas phage nickie]ATW58042.1 hypothetical protein CNR34_00109 [Pseudomonas phage nickie]